jgi:hypothetical protein
MRKPRGGVLDGASLLNTAESWGASAYPWDRARAGGAVSIQWAKLERAKKVPNGRGG